MELKLQAGVLMSRDIPNGQRFFNAMDKTERIRGDCRVLMPAREVSSIILRCCIKSHIHH